MNNKNTHCLNCNQELQGNFCHVCGQESTAVNLNLLDLVKDFLGDMFTYDSRLYRTLFPLFFKPGFLSLEFFRGKRIPYVPPLRLFLFSSFLLFLWFALVDTGIININESPQTGGEISQQLEQPDNTEQSATSNKSEFSKSLSVQLDRIDQSPKVFVNLLISRLPYLMFFMLPFLAAILWLHYCLSGFTYLQHLIFVLHFQSFTYLMTFLLIIANMIYTWSYTIFLGLLFLNIYMFFALRKVYGSSIIGGILKTISVLNLYTIVLGAAFVGFLLLNIMYFE